MDVIKLKSSVNWCKHELRELTPLQPNNKEKVFKFVTDYPIEILRDDEHRLPIGISFHCGPIFYTNQFISQVNMLLKEICPAYNSEGEYIYTVLVFDYDIPSNEKTGVI